MKQNQFSTKAVRLLALAGIASMTMTLAQQASAGWNKAGPFETVVQCNQVRSIFGHSYKVTACGQEAWRKWYFYYWTRW